MRLRRSTSTGMARSGVITGVTDALRGFECTRQCWSSQKVTKTRRTHQATGVSGGEKPGVNPKVYN